MSTTIERPLHGSYLMPAFEHARVADAMHPGILTCEAGASLTDVARLMASHHVHCIAVMGIEREHGGEKLLWSLLTDVDVLRACLTPSGEPTAESIAATEIVSVTPDTPLRDAAELMLSRRLTHVIVVDAATQRPTGVLSTADIAGVLAWGEA